MITGSIADVPEGAGQSAGQQGGGERQGQRDGHPRKVPHDRTGLVPGRLERAPRPDLGARGDAFFPGEIREFATDGGLIGDGDYLTLRRESRRSRRA